MRDVLKKLIRSPYGVMGIVLAMYAVKVVTKLVVGYQVDSPMIQGDGWHNVADVFEACVVIVAVWFSNKPASDEYPMGRKNIESLFSVLVGVGLLYMAFTVAWDACTSTWKIIQGSDLSSPMSGHLAFWAIGVTLGSSVLSLIVSRYQVRIGEETGYESIVADGKETASDAMIELATFIGVFGEVVFGLAWIEYPFALLVAYMMTKTGYDIFSRGMGALMQRSIGLDHDAKIKQLVNSVYGVDEVLQLKTFRSGNKVFLIMKIRSRANSEILHLIKEAVAKEVWVYLQSEDFGDAEFFIRFSRPGYDAYRRAIAIVYASGNPMVASSIKESTHIVVCDIEGGTVVRATEHAIPECEDKRGWIQRLVDEKHVSTLIFYDSAQVRAAERSLSISYTMNGPSNNLSVYGLFS